MFDSLCGCCLCCCYACVCVVVPAFMLYAAVYVGVCGYVCVCGVFLVRFRACSVPFSLCFSSPLLCVVVQVFIGEIETLGFGK